MSVQTPQDYFKLFGIVPAIIGRLWEKRDIFVQMLAGCYKIVFYAVEGVERDNVDIVPKEQP